VAGGLEVLQAPREREAAEGDRRQELCSVRRRGARVLGAKVSVPLEVVGLWPS
jgi:hypothetical protein